MSKRVHIGLDLGISSVGWSIVDEDQNIIARGSHLFRSISNNTKTGNVYGATNRGTARRTRRIYRRKKQRKIDFINMIDKFSYDNQLKIKEKGTYSKFYNESYQEIFGFNESFNSSDFLANEAHKYNLYDIYERAAKGESFKNNPRELFVLLYWKLSMRGALYLPYERPERFTYENSLYKNVFKDKYLNQRNKVRSKQNADAGYIFSFEWNKFELEYILDCNNWLPTSFKKDYLNIFSRQRSFAKGPGSTITQTSDYASPWGIQYDKETKKPLESNLWDKNVGDCVISKAKVKTNCNGWTIQKKWNNFFFLPELINFISQWMNVIKIKDNSNFSINEIKEITNYFVVNNQNCTKTRISKIKSLNLNEKDLDRVPLSKDKKDWEFDKIEKIRKYFNPDEKIIHLNEGCNIFDIIDDLIKIDKLRYGLMVGSDELNIFDPYFIDQTRHKDKKEKKDKMEVNNINISKCIQEAKNLINSLDLNFYEKLYTIDFENYCNFSDFNDSSFSGHAGFCEKAYMEYFNKFTNNKLNDKQNFSTYFRNEIELGNRLNLCFRPKSIYISEDLFKNQEFISPDAMNTINEAIFKLNEIFRKYIFKNDYSLGSIILETTYGDDKEIKNNFLISKSRREEITKEQEFYEKKKKEAIGWAIEHGYDKNYFNDGKNSQDIKRIMLAIEQDFQDVYNPGNDEFRLCVENPSRIKEIQIDHIIPISYSFDNSLCNQVATLKNSDKTNQLPFEFLKDKFQTCKSYWEKWYETNGNKKRDTYFKTKLHNLCIESYDNISTKFISRNLSETTYAISKFKYALDQYIKNLENIFENENQDVNNYQKYQKIKHCQIRTISGSLSQELRKYTINEKSRSVQDHHSEDATICAWYSSLKPVDKFFNNISSEAFFKFHFINKWKWKEFIEKNEPPTLKLLRREFNYNTNNETDINIKDPIWIERLEHSPCIYSYKQQHTLATSFYKKSIEEQMQYLKNEYQPKGIFTLTNYSSYRTYDNVNHELCKYNLMDAKNKTSCKNVNKIFRDIDEKIVNENMTINDICNELSIQTNSDLITKIYNIVKRYTKLFDGELKEDDFIFKPYIDYLKSLEIKDQIHLEGNKNVKLNDYYIDNYLVIISDDAKTFRLIKNIKVILKDEFKPNFICTNSSKLSKTNLDPKYWTKFNQWKCIQGNNWTFAIVVKYYEKNKQKYDFVKLNELGDLVDFDAQNYEIIKIFDKKPFIPIYDFEKKLIDIVWICNFRKSNIVYTSIINTNEKKEYEKSMTTLLKEYHDNYYYHSIIDFYGLSELVKNN